MRIMTEHEAFFIHNIQDQRQALCVFAASQCLPYPAPENAVAVAVRGFAAAVMNLFDYLIRQECIYCDVCSLMPSGARVLRRFLLRNTSPTLLTQIVTLELKLCQLGRHQASKYARSAFRRYFSENRREISTNLIRYIASSQREVITISGQDFFPEPINPYSTTIFHSIDGLEIKLKNYDDAKLLIQAKFKEDVAQISQNLRVEWEHIQGSYLTSGCLSQSKDASSELDVKLLELELQQSIERLAAETSFRSAMAALKLHFPPDPKALPVTQVPVANSVLPVIKYLTLLPTIWEPKKTKQTKGNKKKA